MKVISQYNDWNQSDERSKVNGYGGCGYYRIVQPSRLLGIETKGKEQASGTNDFYYYQIFTRCDVYFTHHMCNPVVFKPMIVQAMTKKKKIIVDLDDDLFSVPENHVAYKTYKHKGASRLGLGVFLTFADAITVSTEHLKNVITAYLKETHKMTKPIFVVENRVDPTMWKEEKTKRRVIGYSGSTSHLHDLKMVWPAIHKVMQKDKKVKFEMLGVLSKDNARKLFRGVEDEILERIAMLGSTVNYDEYPAMLSEKGWKVGIAPLEKNMFNKARSNIKWQEYTMSGAVTIATDFTPYENTNAIKANTEQEWIDAIEHWLDADATEYLKEARSIIDTKFKHSKETLEEIFKPIFASIE